MKRKWISVIVCAVMIVSLTAAVYAAGAAGSEDDPVVTKSYVDAKIAELQNGSQGSGGETDVFHAVNIPAGKKLIGGEGTELILRSGSATALDNGADGVSDLTGGTDLGSLYIRIVADRFCGQPQSIYAQRNSAFGGGSRSSTK